MVKRQTENIFLPYLIFLFISLSLLLGEKIGLVRFLRYPLESLLIPGRQVLTSLKILTLNNIQLLLDRDLRNKIIQSEEAAKELLVLKSKIQLLEEENNSLRKQLQAPLPPSWQFIPASVIGQNRFLLIDKGKKDKIQTNMAVISENIFIGKIHSVFERTSQIILLWDPDFKTPVVTSKNVKGLLMGVFGNKIMLTRVLQRDPLNTLDLVLTSGEEGGLPPNLLIGKIDEVVNKQGEVYKEASITPLIDYNKLRYVYVVLEY